MPIVYSISQSERSVQVVAEGVIEVRDIITTIQMVASDPQVNADFQVIVDLRGMQYDPSIGDLFNVRNIVAGLKSRFQRGIILIVNKPLLPVAELFCIMARAWGVDIDVVTK